MFVFYSFLIMGKITMTQAIAAPMPLYDRDLDLWLETAIAQLKAGDFENEQHDKLKTLLRQSLGRDVDTMLNANFWERS